MGYRGGVVKEFAQACRNRSSIVAIVPITFNYRKCIIGCIAYNTVALISQCCISDTNTHNVNECDVLINRNLIAYIIN